VKDQPGPDGKVVCPTLLSQKCLTCGFPGHTSSYCPDTIRRDQERNTSKRNEYNQTKKASGGWETVGQNGAVVKSKPRIEDMEPKKPVAVIASTAATADTASKSSTKYGGFGVLAVDDSSDSEEEREIAQLPSTVPKPVRKQVAIVTGPPPAVEPAKAPTWAQRAAAAAQKPVSSSSSSAPKPLVDTRFQLHALCDNIEQSKRASSNHRGAAANIASESSKKRKQSSAMVPA
jgi:hypothetical protein